MFLARSPMRSRSAATRIAVTVWRRSTASGWRRGDHQDGLILDLVLETVHPQVRGDDLRAEAPVAGDERRDRVRQEFSGKPPHLADLAAEGRQLLLVGLDDVGVFGHGAPIRGQPKRPVM